MIEDVLHQKTNLQPQNSTEIIQAAELFRTLGDPTRVRILLLLMDGEQNVGGLAVALGLSEAAVSHHLRRLRQMRIVRARRQGKEVYYTLDDDHVSDLLTRGLEHASHP